MARNDKDAPDFDLLVSEYNEWLARSRERKMTDVCRSLVAGLSSVIMGSSSRYPTPHPIYGRKDISPEQKDLIALASDWRRVEEGLQRIIATGVPEKGIEPKDAYMGKVFVRGMYDSLRSSYLGLSGGNQ